MTFRQRRTARSFAVVFAAFWLYRLLVAPWIDPSFEFQEQQLSSEAELERIRDAYQQRMKKYARIFPPGSWELDDPIMLQSDGVELLMNDYENLSHGRIRLSKCTMLYLPNGDPDGAGQVVVLRAPEGALLQFDSELNLRRGQIGKLVGGQLLGPVTVHGTPSRPDGSDELLITTRDIELNEHQATSSHVVQFRYGPNYGQGRGLVVHLQPTRGTSADRREPNVGGLERVELLRDVEMHFLAASAGLLPGDNNQAAKGEHETAPGGAQGQQTPVDIRCRGPFEFDLARRMAAFKTEVRASRALGPTTSDEMTGDLLEVYFAEKTQAVADRPPPTSPPGTPRGLQPERFFAAGRPVKIDAPSSGLYVRAGQVEYEHQRRRIRIEAASQQPDATLVWNDAKLDGKFGGRSLVIERRDAAGLPLVTAKGPGWFELAEPAGESRVIKARWTSELVMRPEAGSQVVSILGDASTDFVGFGELSAAEIHLWLKRLNQAAAAQVRGERQNPVVPERLLAIGAVTFDAPQLSGDTERLDIEFDPAGSLLPTPPVVARTMAEPPGRSPSVATGSVTPTQARAEADRTGQRQLSSIAPQLTPASTARGTMPSAQHFELHGDSIRAKLWSRGELTRLNHATIAGRVRLKETRTQKPEDRPLEIAGDQLELRDAATPRQTTMTVFGKPASVAARGLEMRGAQVNLDSRRNLLWIDGAGQTTLPPSMATETANATTSALPASRSFPGIDSLAGAPITVDFVGGMRFDGKTARFEREVKITSEQQSVAAAPAAGVEIQRRVMESEVVEVHLRRPIDFADQQASPSGAEVQNVACSGPVVMTDQRIDARGVVAAATVTMRDLTIDQLTGDIHAFGPGSLESTRLGSSLALFGGTGNRATSSAAQSDSLQYARVNYQGAVTGNTRGKQLVLHDDIRGGYGPILRWGDKLDLNAKQIGPKEIRFRSDELQVREAPGVENKTSTTELVALGNTDVYGEKFSAQAHRLTYVQDKAQLIMEGDGRSAAELYYQPEHAAPWTRARGRKLEYWVNTGEAKIPDAQLFELGQIPPMGQPAK
jgi:hypothetical protein